MTKMTIKYSDEYVNEMINKEIKKRKIRRTRKIVRTTVKVIACALILIGIIGIFGATGKHELGNSSNIQYILVAAMSLGITYAGAWTLDKFKLVTCD